MHELKLGLDEKEYRLLKGAMWTFRRNAADLDPGHREAAAQLLECAPDLRKAYDLREELSAIFDAKQSNESTKHAITALKWYDSFLTRLDN